jgi:hypothetical protein
MVKVTARTETQRVFKRGRLIVEEIVNDTPVTSSIDISPGANSLFPEKIFLKLLRVRLLEGARFQASSSGEKAVLIIQ